jgi:hypothetical protein
MTLTVKKILELADDRELTLGEFTDLLSTSERIVHDWAKEVREPTIRDIVTISEYFSVSCDYLLKDDIEIMNPAD